MDIINNEINSYRSKLKKIRVCKGFTQHDLAELSGINIKSIAIYEQDTSKINKASLETVYRLADSLGCSMEDLIEEEYITEVPAIGNT